MRLKEGYFTVNLFGVPTFYQKMPATAVFTRLHYNEVNFNLTMWYVNFGNEELRKFKFDLSNKLPNESNMGSFVGEFVHNNLRWYIYRR